MRPRILFALAVLAACGSPSKDAKTGDDAGGEETTAGATLAGGTTVCMGSVLGMRYPVEDALTENELEPVDHCLSADVKLEETGEPGAYVLRYQKTGDEKWMQCDSKEQDRVAFLRECVVQMMDDLGGGAAATAASESDAEE